MKHACRSRILHLPVWLRVAAICLLGATTSAVAQDIADLCGCARAAGKAFDAGDPRTYPAGTTGCPSACDGGTIVLPLPEDGVLRFSSFKAEGAFTISFRPNATNTAATLLVAGSAQQVLRIDQPYSCRSLRTATAAAEKRGISHSSCVMAQC